MRHLTPLTPLFITRGIITLLIIAGSVMRLLRLRTPVQPSPLATNHRITTGDRLIFTPSVAESTDDTGSLTTGSICLKNDAPNASSTEPHCRRVEIADTQNEQHQGLMHRETLTDDEGMLFVFDNTQIRQFWMRDTLIPLDMIWVDSERQVQGITHALPCPDNASDSACPRYRSPVPVPYVLEIVSK